MRDLLSDLRRLAWRLPEHEINRMIRQLKRSADEAGDHVTALQREEVDAWVTGVHTHYPARPEQDPAVTAARAAHHRLLAGLRQLHRLYQDDRPLSRESRRLIEAVEQDLAQAGEEATPAQRRCAGTWIARLDERGPGGDAPQRPAPRGAGRTPHGDGRSTNRQGGRPAKTQRPRLPEAKVAEVAAAVRGALKKAAREASTTSWSRLRRQLGSALPHLDPADRVAVLAEVDAHTPADEPLLTALVAAGDTSTPAVYERVAKQLGRTVPTDTTTARAQWQTDALHLQQLYRYK
jgi:hypothetical protein